MPACGDLSPLEPDGLPWRAWLAGLLIHVKNCTNNDNIIQLPIIECNYFFVTKFQAEDEEVVKASFF
jgi:hypothetical protein